MQASMISNRSIPLGARAIARLATLPALLALGSGCSVSNLDYATLSCERALDCPAPFVCVAHGTTGVCVPADQAVSTSDGGVCDTTMVLFSRDVQPIFTARCASGGCHSPVNPQGGLSLAAPGTVARLVNQPTSPDCNAAAPNVVRVKPNDPMNSMLWRKTSDAATKCFDRMPLLPNSLSVIAPCEFSKLEAWINQGAPDN